MINEALNRAIAQLGSAKIGAACGVTYQAVNKWQKAGRLPRTEWTGETDYATKIAAMPGAGVSREALLERPSAESAGGSRLAEPVEEQTGPA